jgi:hypothetical protein
MKIYFNFTLAMLMFLITSCDNQKIEEGFFEEPELIVTFRSTTYNFSQYEDEFHAFWDAAIEEYTMETFCACDCNSALTAQDAFNDHYSLLPEEFQFQPTNLDCSDLMPAFGYACGLTVPQIANRLRNDLVVNEFFTSEEVILVSNLISDLEINGINVNFNDYRDSWTNLTSSSSVNNGVSAFFIETAQNVITKMDLVFDGVFDEDEEPQAILSHALGALGGGWWAAITHVAHQPSWDPIGDDFWDDVAWGAAGGGLLAI